MIINYFLDHRSITCMPYTSEQTYIQISYVYIYISISIYINTHTYIHHLHPPPLPSPTRCLPHLLPPPPSSTSCASPTLFHLKTRHNPPIVDGRDPRKPWNPPPKLRKSINAFRMAEGPGAEASPHDAAARRTRRCRPGQKGRRGRCAPRDDSKQQGAGH